MAKVKKTEKTPTNENSGNVPEKTDINVLEELEALLEEEKTTLVTLYIVNGSADNVTLEITVEGEGQTSLMTVKLDDKMIALNNEGNLSKRPLGANMSLNGKKLSIVANIADTSRKTNFTGLKIRLEGGVIPMEFPLFKTVNEEGQSADYLCQIKFFKP